jgi:elongation factor Ts
VAEITAALVKELRDKTGAGMMDCKKALTETEGDMEKAVDWLREKGLAAAAKKAGRIAAEGRVHAVVTGNRRTGVLVEVNCETDFVAKGEQFVELCETIAQQLVRNDADHVRREEAPEGAERARVIYEQALHSDPAKTVGHYVTEAIARIGENIAVRRFARFVVDGEGLVHSYIHGDGRVGVLVEIGGGAGGEVGELAHEIALQVAFSRPAYISREEVPASVVEHEKEVLRAQAINEGKKPEIAERMVQGRIEKYYKENCLLEQVWVKDDKRTVGDLIGEYGKKAGARLSLRRLVRFEKGEGIEKRADDFAAEVAKAAGLNR